MGFNIKVYIVWLFIVLVALNHKDLFCLIPIISSKLIICIQFRMSIKLNDVCTAFRFVFFFNLNDVGRSFSF